MRLTLFSFLYMCSAIPPFSSLFLVVSPTLFCFLSPQAMHVDRPTVASRHKNKPQEEPPLSACALASYSVYSFLLYSEYSALFYLIFRQTLLLRIVMILYRVRKAIISYTYFLYNILIF